VIMRQASQIAQRPAQKTLAVHFTFSVDLQPGRHGREDTFNVYKCIGLSSADLFWEGGRPIWVEGWTVSRGEALPEPRSSGGSLRRCQSLDVIAPKFESLAYLFGIAVTLVNPGDA
jgi:hypothetical protein